MANRLSSDLMIRWTPPDRRIDEVLSDEVLGEGDAEAFLQPKRSRTKGAQVMDADYDWSVGGSDLRVEYVRQFFFQK